MGCDTCRELISADLDGEADDAERAAMADHLATCAACASFSIDAARLHRSSRVAPAAVIPDLTDAILERAAADADGLEGAPADPGPGPSPDPVPAPDRTADGPASAGAGERRIRRRRGAHPRRWSPAATYAMQYGLLVVALLMMVLAVPDLLASSGSAIHASRHLGGWDVAFAVGLCLAALQPWRARGLLPMAAALAGVMVITAVIDIAHGSTPGLAEGTHLLEVLGLVFLWLLSRSVPLQDRPRRSLPSAGSDDGAAATPIARLRALPTRFGWAPVPSMTPVPSVAVVDPAVDPVPVAGATASASTPVRSEARARRAA